MKEHEEKSNVTANAQCNAVYGFGFIGAAIYYISVAAGFWAGVIGVLKAIIWPVFVVFELLKHLNA